VTRALLVGPTLLNAHVQVVSAAIVRKPLSGVWIVDVSLDSIEFDNGTGAKTYFHRHSGGPNGVIVEAAIYPPATPRSVSFEGHMSCRPSLTIRRFHLARPLIRGTRVPLR